MYRLNKSTIFRGRAIQIPVIYIDDSGNNLFTSGMTGAHLRIENEDGSFIQKDPASGFAWGVTEQTYLHVYAFSAAETLLMKKGVDKSAWLCLIFGESSVKYELKKFLTIQDDAY